MKVKTKWILIGIAVILALTVIGIVIALNLKKDYFEKLPYDHLDQTVYNGTYIVGEDNAFYLVRDGKQVSREFTWIKSVNDFYDNMEEELEKDDSDLILFDYYLARVADDTNLRLVTSEGEELSILGDNYTLKEVNLPYLIFENNTTSRVSALSLLSLDSDLSSKSSDELTLSTSFSTITAAKNDESSALYSHLITEDIAKEQPKTVYESRGIRILNGTTITRKTFYTEDHRPVFFWINEESNSVYSNEGQQISKGNDPIYYSENQNWAYQLSEPLSESAVSKKFIVMFSGAGSLILSEDEYDLSSSFVQGNCLQIKGKASKKWSLINGSNLNQSSYQTITSTNLLLCAKEEGSDQTIYLNEDGEILMTSEYSDMMRSSLSSDTCTVLNSNSYNADHENKRFYHFTAPQREPVTIDFPISSTITRYSQQDALSNIYLVTEEADDGTVYSRLCVPFSTRPLSDPYHHIDTYSHLGIQWCLGTNYVTGRYDLIDPINNQVAYSLSVSAEDFARLRFEYVDAHILVTDPYDTKSGVPVAILSLSQSEEKNLAIGNTRYFALYRAATLADDHYDEATLHILEIGQNLLRSDPLAFFPESNYLILHSASGSQAYRLDESLALIQTFTTSYAITDICVDVVDPTLCYPVIASGGYDSLDNTTYGLTDEEGELLLAPYYDSIEFAENGEFLVTLRGSYGVLEIRKNKVHMLIDYCYEIVPLGDNGYLTMDGMYGTMYLYESGKKVFDDPIHGFSYVEFFETDEEGVLLSGAGVIFSIGNDLYLHTPICVQAPCTNFEVPENSHEEIADRQAVLLCYYDTNSNLLYTDVILPTEKHVEEFELREGVWYDSPSKDNQITSLSKNDILLSAGLGERTIKLYQQVKSDSK